MPMLVRTVVIDDSAFVRKTVQEILSSSPFVEVVGTARDGEEGLAVVERLKPDVVTCDLTMPRMDGVEFVRRQMVIKPVPILMLTSSPEDCEGVMAAIEAGAIDLVQKPSALAQDTLRRVREELLEKVKEAARTPLAKQPRPVAPAVSLPLHRAQGADVVVIGVSTGGPQALRYLVPQFPRDFPAPLAIVLHMPEGYTALFAQKLGGISELNVIEARDGEPLTAGTVAIAKAGLHLKLRKDVAGLPVMELTRAPGDKLHRPSVDVLFQSAAENFGPRVLAIVLTGMGSDGREGSAWVKARGGVVLTEAEESCVVFGMPRAVAESGLSDAAYSLPEMAQGISKHL
jgi:two-component system chemotaxis response regulator CheB